MNLLAAHDCAYMHVSKSKLNRTGTGRVYEQNMIIVFKDENLSVLKNYYLDKVGEDRDFHQTLEGSDKKALTD